jgi:hypothetical protein
MDYSKVDEDELKEEIYLRQLMGTLMYCRALQESLVDVVLTLPSGSISIGSNSYQPRQALPCTMCGHQPILTAACSWRGGAGDVWRTKVNFWIECKCGPEARIQG